MKWKRPEEEEIDLLDLLRRLMRYLHWIVLCGLVFAGLFGAYQSRKNTTSTVADYKEQAEMIKLTADEQQDVQLAKNIYDDVLQMQDYKDKSIYINIDPSDEKVITMLYDVSVKEKSARKQTLERYISFARDGGVVKYIQEHSSAYQDQEEVYLSELIEIWNVEDMMNKDAWPDSQNIEVDDRSHLFYMTVKGDDLEKTAEMANLVQKALEEFSVQMKDKMAANKLTLLNRQEGVCYDETLAEDRRQNNMDISDSKSRIKALTDVFTDDQKTVSNAYLQEKGMIEPQNEEVSTSGVLKYVILGFFLGVIAWCGIYTLIYICSGTVKTQKDLECGKNIRIFGTVDSRRKGKAEKKQKEQERVLVQIEMLCEDLGINSLGLLPAASLKTEEESWMQMLRKRLEGNGVQTQVVENVYSRPDQWKKLRTVGAVVPIYHLLHTKYADIDAEMGIYAENHIPVLGIIAVEK